MAQLSKAPAGLTFKSTDPDPDEEQRRIAWRLAELARREQRETAERWGLFGT